MHEMQNLILVLYLYILAEYTWGEHTYAMFIEGEGNQYKSKVKEDENKNKANMFYIVRFCGLGYSFNTIFDEHTNMQCTPIDTVITHY